ncbi:MAG TPA: DUF4333 domain-containing protein [Aldersonia sp.]
MPVTTSSSLRRIAAACCAAAVSIAMLAGCSKTVDKGDVAEQISNQLAAQVGTTPDSVECPDDLDAEVGATMTCTLTADGTDYEVGVNVTSVDGDDVAFDIDNKDGFGQQTTGDRNAVAEQISAVYAEQVGAAPDSVECPDDLAAEVGATLTCVLTHEGASFDVDVTVTEVTGDDVSFDIQFADQPN